jgi:2-methylisocitrate lyase-like PEP mutase family enzyme
MSSEAMVGQVARAEAFAALHRQSAPLLLVNVWDAWSARIAVASGAPAVGTSSFAVALHHGVGDGERMPFEAVLEVCGAIAAAAGVPTTVDLEAGHGANAEAVAGSARAVLRAGAVGLNLEDAVPQSAGRLFDAEDQATRLAAARQAAEAHGVPAFVNARCDVWFGAALDGADPLEETLRRAEVYAAAGADGLFLPGLADLDVLARITAATPLAVNVMTQPGMPALADLQAAGVRRVSQGGSPFLVAAGALGASTREYLQGDLVPRVELMGAGLATIPGMCA